MVGSRALLVLDLDDQVDFHGNVEGQCGDADGRAGVFSLISKNFDEKLGGSIDDLRVAVEIRFRIDESIQGDDLPHLVERADFILDHGKAIEDAQAGPLLGLVD